jgi:hypothetical protein
MQTSKEVCLNVEKVKLNVELLFIQKLKKIGLNVENLAYTSKRLFKRQKFV